MVERRDQRAVLYEPTNPAMQFQTHTLERELLAVIPTWRNACVLDVGCGTGSLMALAQEWGAYVRGIDADKRRVEVAKGKGLGLAADHGLATDLPYETGSFDIVCQSMLLSELGLHDRGRAAAEIRRVLAPGGMVVSFDMCLPSPHNPAVLPITRRTLTGLFPNLGLVSYKRIGLAPPIARRLVRWPTLTAVAQGLRVANSHALAVLADG